MKTWAKRAQKVGHMLGIYANGQCAVFIIGRGSWENRLLKRVVVHLHRRTTTRTTAVRAIDTIFVTATNHAINILNQKGPRNGNGDIVLTSMNDNPSTIRRGAANRSLTKIGPRPGAGFVKTAVPKACLCYYLCHGVLFGQGGTRVIQIQRIMLR